MRLRYTTSHPRDVDDALIAAHRDVPELMPFLHLPVQSGSDRVLTSDEPQAHRRRLSPHRRKAAPGAARPRAVVGFHRRLSRRERRAISGTRSISCARSGLRRPSRSNIRRAPAPRPRARRTRFRSRSRPSVSPNCRLCCSSSSARSTPPASARCCRCCSRSRDGMTASSSAAAPICRPCTPRSGRERIGEIVPVLIERAEPNSLAGTIAPAEPAFATRADARLSGGTPQAEHRA